MSTDKIQPRSGADRRLKYALSDNRKDKHHRHWTNHQYENWNALVQDHLALAKNLQGNKFAAGGLVGGWLRPGPAATESETCKFDTCTKRHKTAETVAFRSFIDLDFDAHDPDMPERVAKLGVAALVYWTHKSTLGNQRWRIKVHTDKDMLPHEYRLAACWVQSRLAPGQEGFDSNSHNPAWTMYRPASTVPDDFRIVVLDGEPLSVDEACRALVGPRLEAKEPVERPDVDLAAPASPEECARAEGLFQRFLEGVRESYGPGDGPGNRHNTFLGTDPEGHAGLSGALMFRFAAGGCLDLNDVKTRIFAAAEEADWDPTATEDRVAGAMALGKAQPSRPYMPEPRDEAEDVFDVVEEEDDWADLGLSGPAVDGPALFAEVEGALRRYLFLPNDDDYMAITLWVATTHVIDQMEHATRLSIEAPEKRCGKSRALDIVGYLSARPLSTANASVAAITRSIKPVNPPTILIDEADAIFGTKRSADANEDLRSVLNSGHARGKPVLRWNIHAKGGEGKLDELQTFAPVALAGIGSPPDTISDRSVRIHMRRRPKDQTVAPFRMKRDGEGVFRPLAKRLKAWADEQTFDQDEDVELPVEDRAADNWASLVMVADRVGSNWPERARAAAVRMTNGAPKDEDSFGHEALRDVRRVWPEGAPTMHSAVLVELLHALEQSPWAKYGRDRGGLTPAHLARLLGPYGVDTKQVKIGGQNLKGYRVEDWPCKPGDEDCSPRGGLGKAWASYLDNETTEVVHTEDGEIEEVEGDA